MQKDICKAWVFSVLLAGMSATLGGCEIAGVLLHQLIGEPPVDAQYDLPKGPTLVLVENYRSPDAIQFDADQISHAVTDELKKPGKIEVINPDKVLALRDEDESKYRTMNIAAVGKAVGAKQVIYVDLVESEVNKDPSAGAVSAQATARVRVVDSETGRTLWPSNATAGKELSQPIDFQQVDPSHVAAMHTQLLTKLSSKIAKLFYRWSPDDQAQEDNGG